METQELTTKQYNKVTELCMLTKDFTGFEFEGLLIEGNVAFITKQYVKENPSKKFRTWLIDKELVIKELTINK